jgi:hypothetical protein
MIHLTAFVVYLFLRSRRATLIPLLLRWHASCTDIEDRKRLRALRGKVGSTGFIRNGALHSGSWKVAHEQAAFAPMFFLSPRTLIRLESPFDDRWFGQIDFDLKPQCVRLDVV